MFYGRMQLLAFVSDIIKLVIKNYKENLRHYYVRLGNGNILLKNEIIFKLC